MSNSSSPCGPHDTTINRSKPDQSSPCDRDDLGNSNIKVICRFRPSNEFEKSKGKTIADPVNDATVLIGSRENRTTYTFDRVFDVDSTQQEIYQYSISQAVEDFLNGYNGTILAYGQTGSGKSYTMMGPSISDKEQQGIIPRICNEIFDKINNSSSDIEYTVGVSYMEIYMEQIRDLLDPRSDTNSKFIIQEDKVHGIHVKGLSQAFVSSSNELYSVLSQGSKERSHSITNMNIESSRSHAILQINLSQKQLFDDTIKRSHLFLVDLAGSEKVDKTGAMGQTLEEAKKINSSLSALGNVINSLTDGKSSHIPYRDSKLTRILQESLGGNSRTSLIINCSPSSINELETLSTLRFGSRAKKIKNNAHINTELSPISLQLKIQSLEETNKQNQAYIQKLESELSQRKGITPHTPCKSYATHLGEDKSPTDYPSKIPIATLNSPNRSNKSHQLIDELKLRDAKIAELENTVLSMKMQNLKVSHQEELKLFKLEDTLHKLNDKLNDVEIINVNLRKHLLISEKIIESRDVKIEKLKSSLMEQQSQVLRDGMNFEQKLSSIKERLDAYAKQKSNEQTETSVASVNNDDSHSTYKNYNTIRNNDDHGKYAILQTGSTSGKPSAVSVLDDPPTSPVSPKIGLNLNIVKPLRGGRSYFDEQGYF
ncbi:uncharacterized protein AC631_02324 [Debaryomyces fabryi]|uniref:Kinesin-like protein n=1 Tax=Debaryomyces fabryi TaxID=58627 RepID=A0A0V1Q0G5_9ASCO|nr:uncharacterized protein AC631_02324 [Debaryomyces fabryi]KSA01952.1 hypothetical protein AC631_02324 [Debaryomyces fabryi]CUM48484.1 unnamed protein product [Debaryomyces fabryi]